MLKENKVLAVVMLGVVMAAIDTTVVLLALPSITQELHTSLGVSIWVILVYLLIAAVATTQLGRLGDLFGRSRLFNAGFVIFTVGSLLCGLAPNALFLIGARVVQAVGGAVLEATSGAIIADTFDKSRRGRAFGYIGIGWNLGSVLGIVIGGVLTTFVGWRFIFYVNIPVGIFGFLFGRAYLNDNKVVRESLDIAGMCLLAASLGLMSLGAVYYASAGLSAIDELMFAAGFVLLPVFVWWEGRTKEPMIPIAIFKRRTFRASMLATLFQSIGFLSLMFLITLYLQGVKGLSPLDAAMLMLPSNFLSGMFAPFMGGLSDRFGARRIATLGIGLMCVTVLIYLTLTATTPLYVMVLASLVAGTGASMFWPANTSAVMSHSTADRHGSISGLLRTISNVGALGSYIASIAVASAAVSRQVAFSMFAGTSSLIGGLSQSFMSGFDAAMVLSLLAMAIAGVLSYMREDGKEKLA